MAPAFYTAALKWSVLTRTATVGVSSNPRLGHGVTGRQRVAGHGASNLSRTDTVGLPAKKRRVPGGCVPPQTAESNYNYNSMNDADAHIRTTCESGSVAT